MNGINYRSRPLGSVEALAQHLRVSEKFLASICAGPADRHYREVYRDPATKGTRLPDKVYYDAKPALKKLQRRIVSAVFRNIAFPPYIVGGVPGRSLRDAVSIHLHARSLMTFDVVRFFESTKREHVQRAIRIGLDFPPDVASLLTDLTTVNGHVPRGAPTSTYIANLVLGESEHRFAAWLADYSNGGFRYTRWIDDMTVTSRDPIQERDVKQVTSSISALLRRYGLGFAREVGVPRANRVKRRVDYDTRVVTVHNVEIRGRHMSVRKPYRRGVRAGIHSLSKAVASAALDEGDLDRLASLSSSVGHIADFHPRAAASMRAAIRSINVKNNEWRRVYP